jgi:hypothetical protein
MSALSQYVDFPAQTFGAPASEHVSEAVIPQAAAPASSASRPANSLKKGLTLEQVEDLLGQPTETHESSNNGLKVTSYSFQTKDSNVQADFVNGVLVQYNIASR